MPPRSSRSTTKKSQRLGGPRKSRSTTAKGEGTTLRRASFTASTSSDEDQASDADKDSHAGTLRDDDRAPLVDVADKKQETGRRKRHNKLVSSSPSVGLAIKWPVMAVIVVVLIVAASLAYYHLQPLATNDAVPSQQSTATTDHGVQPPPVVQEPDAGAQLPVAPKPATDADPAALPAHKQAKPPVQSVAEVKEKPKQAPSEKAPSGVGGDGGGGMQVHPDPVPQPRFAHSPWDYCEAPVVLPKPGPDEPNDSTHTLHHAFIFVRHGDRTPTTWPVASANFSATPGANSHSVTPLWSNCDPVIVSSRTGTKRYPDPQWPGTCVLGQLTRLGAHQLNRLGRFYGQQYRSLVRTRNIRIKSTDFNRTIASAVHFAMGLYAPQRLPLPPAQLVETQHPSEDPLSLSNPKLTNTIFDYFDPTDLLAGRHGLPKLMAFGNQPWTERNLGRLFDMVATARCHDIAMCLPEALPVGHGPGPCLSPVVMDRLIAWAGKQFMRVSRGFARATGGRALRELVVNGRANPGLSVFATHDTTIAVVLRALDVKVDVWPAYASQIVVEKWVGKEPGIEGQVKYRVLYNGNNVCKGKGKCGILYE